MPLTTVTVTCLEGVSLEAARRRRCYCQVALLTQEKAYLEEKAAQVRQFHFPC